MYIAYLLDREYIFYTYLPRFIYIYIVCILSIEYTFLYIYLIKFIYLYSTYILSVFINVYKYIYKNKPLHPSVNKK